MAKVRVRALQQGFDGQVRRQPGDEFDYDIERQGQGKWFELVNEAKSREHADEKPKKRSSKKKASKKRSRSVDDFLA